MATRDTGGQERAGKRADEVDETADASGTAPASDVQDRVGKLSDDVDSLLDEIDDVLEENAEDFVRAYIQKGGQ